MIHMNGGVILGQADPLRSDILFDVGTNASIRLDGLFVHNIVLSTIGRGITTWATGPGAFHAARCESYDMSRLPVRLHDGHTTLADPDFAADGWQDMIWRLADTATPIASRHGEDGDTLLLRRTVSDGKSALTVVRRSSAGTPASLVLLCLPVRPGDQVLAGFQVRRDPRGPGGKIVLGVAPNWARIDGHDAQRVPIVTKLASTGAVDIEPEADRYTVVTPTGFRSSRIAPSWATHFVIIVDLTRADPANLLFRGLWCDTM
jgi:hypothetical protein